MKWLVASWLILPCCGVSMGRVFHKWGYPNLKYFKINPHCIHWHLHLHLANRFFLVQSASLFNGNNTIMRDKQRGQYWGWKYLRLCSLYNIFNILFSCLFCLVHRACMYIKIMQSISCFTFYERLYHATLLVPWTHNSVWLYLKTILWHWLYFFMCWFIY